MTARMLVPCQLCKPNAVAMGMEGGERNGIGFPAALVLTIVTVAVVTLITSAVVYRSASTRTFTVMLVVPNRATFVQQVSMSPIHTGC